MAIRKKGTHKINVNGAVFRYVERKGNFGWVVFDSKHDDTQKLIVNSPNLEVQTKYQIHDEADGNSLNKVLSWGAGFSQSRELLRRAILTGLNLGWQPQNKDKDIELSIIEKTKKNLYIEVQ